MTMLGGPDADEPNFNRADGAPVPAVAAADAVLAARADRAAQGAAGIGVLADGGGVAVVDAVRGDPAAAAHRAAAEIASCHEMDGKARHDAGLFLLRATKYCGGSLGFSAESEA